MNFKLRRTRTYGYTPTMYSDLDHQTHEDMGTIKSRLSPASSALSRLVQSCNIPQR